LFWAWGLNPMMYCIWCELGNHYTTYVSTVISCEMCKILNN
jgi:hypothetical protein